MGLPLPPLFPGSSHSPILLPPLACLSHVVPPPLTRASIWPHTSLSEESHACSPTTLVSSLLTNQGKDLSVQQGDQLSHMVFTTKAESDLKSEANVFTRTASERSLLLFSSWLLLERWALSVR